MTDKTIEKTIRDRGTVYGKFENNCTITNALYDVIKSAPNYHDLTPQHKEAYHMIFHKISRSVCGDPMHTDNVHDIVGYAKLLEDFLVKQIEAE